LANGGQSFEVAKDGLVVLALGNAGEKVHAAADELLRGDWKI
jgi:hypothetical protein